MTVTLLFYLVITMYATTVYSADTGNQENVQGQIGWINLTTIGREKDIRSVIGQLYHSDPSYFEQNIANNDYYSFRSTKYSVYITQKLTTSTDCVMLIVNAEDIMFEDDLRKNINLLNNAKALGINQLIIAVMRMEYTEPPFSEDRFNEIRKELYGAVRNIGFDPKAIACIPISNRENIFEKSENMDWYEGNQIVTNDPNGQTKIVDVLTVVNAIDAAFPQ